MSLREKLGRMLLGTSGTGSISVPVPHIDPDVKRDDDGTVTLTAKIPGLDPASLQVEHAGAGHFVVRGSVRPVQRGLRRVKEDLVFNLHLPEASDWQLTTSYDDPTLTIRVPAREQAG
jgi:HSP20 family molecular chaperone IbpA